MKSPLPKSNFALVRAKAVEIMTNRVDVVVLLRLGSLSFLWYRVVDNLEHRLLLVANTESERALRVL